MTLEAALSSQRRLVDALRDPGRYPHPAGPVSLIETHISFVLLAGDFVYKIKKAVDLGFVDYSSLERRRHFCAEELRLNRRLAPRLYLDVVPIGGTPEDPRLESAGAPFEYAVKMARFSQDNLLDRLLTRGELSPGHIDTVAATVAAFHGTVPAADSADGHGSPAAVWAPAEANFAHLRTLAGSADRSLLDALESWSRSEYQRQEGLIAQRQARGFVRECHGDLHLGNMALLEDGPTVFDCIEFNPELRWIDVINDVAFLVMDLGERGRPDYAWHLVNDWLEATGDYAGLRLLPFYQVYRAMVRAKVAHIRAADPSLTGMERESAAASGAAYLAFAKTIVSPPPPALLVTHGFSGSGKTTLARQVAEGLGAIRLRSDVERKRLHRLPPLARSNAGIGDGLYADGVTAATYDRLAELAAEVIAAGYPAIVDAACLKGWQRDRFRTLAENLGVPCLILHCEAPRVVLEERLSARARSGQDASEATPAVLEMQLGQQDPLTPDEEAMALSVNTNQADCDRLVPQIRQHLGRAP